MSTIDIHLAQSRIEQEMPLFKDVIDPDKGQLDYQLWLYIEEHDPDTDAYVDVVGPELGGRFTSFANAEAVRNAMVDLAELHVGIEGNFRIWISLEEIDQVTDEADDMDDPEHGGVYQTLDQAQAKLDQMLQIGRWWR